MLDLSSNKIKQLVPVTASAGWIQYKLESVKSLNLSDNPLTSIQHTCEIISLLMPAVTDLQISLF
jgi:Leucine-rich repeat (LRR) protein